MFWGADAILGYFCAAASAFLFLLSYVVLVVGSGGRALLLLLLVLLLSAGVLALMAFRLLRRKKHPVPSNKGPSVVSAVLGMSMTSPRGQLISLCLLAVIFSIPFVVPGGGRKGADVARQSTRDGGGFGLASRPNSGHNRIDWRGADGEEMIVRPSVAKPNGERIRLVNNPQASDPTYRKLIEFLRSDASDRRPYIDGQWVCANYAEEVHNSAERADIRCALVTIWFVDGESHSCNLFRTVDRGLVYIDCTGGSVNEGPPNHDMVVEVEVGKSYVPRHLFPSDGWEEMAEPAGVVRDFTVHW